MGPGARRAGRRVSILAARPSADAGWSATGGPVELLPEKVGLFLSLAAGSVLAQILYQVSPADPTALIGSSVLLAAAAFCACYLPARRAASVDPNVALRHL